MGCNKDNGLLSRTNGQGKMKFKQKIFLFLYYVFARWLPSYNDHRCFTVKFRIFLCRHFFLHCGRHVNIQRGVYFGKGLNISIGDYSGIGADSVIGNANAEVSIGNNTLIGQELIIYTHTHRYMERSKLIQEQGGIDKPVRIGSDVWIGSRVTIMPGVIINDGAVIGAGAVVTHDVPPFAIIGGVPARVIKYRA